MDEQSQGRIESPDGAHIVESYAETVIKMKLHEQSLGLLLLAALGTDTPTAKSSPNTAVYDHVFTVNNSNAHPSLTVALKSANDDVRFPLAMLDSLKFECKPDSYPTVEATFMSKPYASASNTPSFATEKDFLSRMLTFKLASSQSGLDAASAVKIRSFTMEIKKNLFSEYNLGSNSPNEIANQTFEISGSVTLMNTDTTYSDIQLAETSKALRFDFLHTDTIGTSANPEVKIDLYNARLSNYQRNMGLNDLVEESFDFTALWDTTTSAMVAITLTNLIASY